MVAVGAAEEEVVVGAAAVAEEVGVVVGGVEGMARVGVVGPEGPGSLTLAPPKLQTATVPYLSVMVPARSRPAG